MGYARIEHLAGGAASLDMPTFDVGAIDKVTDARGEEIVRAKRDKNMSARRGRTAKG